MRKTLFLLASLIGILTSVQFAAPSQCPLDFSSAVKPSGDCFPLPQDNLTESQCCYTTYLSFASVLAYNTNRSSVEQLFLGASEEAACAEEAHNVGLTTPYCDIGPPAFTAGEDPCLFESKSQLEGNLSNTPVTFSNLSATCANVQGENGSCTACLKLYNEAISILVNKSTNVSVDTNCRTALLVSLTSGNITQLEWRSALYSCIIPFALYDPQIVYIATRPGGTISVPLAALWWILVFLVVLGPIIYLIRKTRRPQHSGADTGDDSEGGKTVEDGEQPANEGSLYEFSAKELDRATDGFNEKNFIREGSAGRVYKGTLPSGQLVAVKTIHNATKSGTFYKEIENLSRVRHPNLVTLLGYCQAADQNLLVYEYCSKGNLWYYLLGGGHALTWDQRLKIAVGSARGLMYLHVNPGGYIVHRDIKPTNILLTGNYEAKVADFGLSRFITFDESRVFTEVKGTAGYLDPEYANQGTLTFSSDVYSFGVVLLQLVSGMRPINLDPSRPFSLLKMANLVARGEAEVSDFVDPRLEGAYSELICRRVIEIAVQCTLEHGVYRPSMVDVRQGLEEAWALGDSPVAYESAPSGTDYGSPSSTMEEGTGS